ncbi:MAG TPA: hypothetical protein VH309_07585, partial [Elusimicrobiota bacterium]|nr:hypothetical protein [Elusimicrobiota bacterium]
MRNTLFAVLLLVPTAARAASSPSARVAVSSAAAGAELPAYAPSTAPLTLDLVASRFAELDAKMNTLRADFGQFVRLEGSDTVQEVEGEVLFKKPDLMRL